MLILFRAFRLTLLSSAAAVLGQYMICCIEPLANITLEGFDTKYVYIMVHYAEDDKA